MSFTCDAIDAIDAAAASGKLRFYNNGSEVRRAIQQLLENDVRPEVAYRRFVDNGPQAMMHFRFDMLKIGYVRLSNNTPSPSPSAAPLPTMQVCEVTLESARDARDMDLGRKPRY